MPVLQVTQTVGIQPNHVYVIAPALQLAMGDGQLRVTAQERTPGKPVAVDLFFRTLAQAQGERAIAVVLSGSGSDGSVGLADMKREGGVTFAQSPEDAEYGGMPSAAVATQLASDIDERALATARHGRYPEGIVTDVAPTRLRDYFEHEGGA